MTQRAALVTGRETVELREFPDPTPDPSGVVVDIAFCGVCGTDIHAYQSGDPYNPAVCGHEWVGTVSASGAEVRRVREGDRVVVATPPACGTCAPCRAGQPDVCATSFLFTLGRDPLAPPHGGFAPSIAVAEGRVTGAEPTLTDEQAAQVEPATITLHAVRASRLRPGDTVVVQGAGPIGLLTMQFARAAGAGHLVVVEPNADRRALAGTLGATATAEPGDEAQTVIRELSSGLGADLVFECAGRPELIQTAVDLARRGGAVTLVGFTTEAATITPAQWMVKEISLRAALGYTHQEFGMAMAMLADGRVQVDPLHTLTVGLDGFADVMVELASGTSPHTKVLVDPRR